MQPKTPQIIVLHKCPHCPRKFYTTAGLNVHAQIAHPVSVIEPLVSEMPRSEHVSSSPP